MDTKSLAKSKRAHSQHHSKKHHPNRAQKVPSSSSIGASSSKKPPGNEIKDKPRPPQGSSPLLSNWDRYENDFDLGSEDQSGDGTNQPTDVLLPKSKGADYAYLISEAKSQNETSCATEIFPSFNDVVQDFDQGMGTFLSVRGQSISSWVESDSFIVEDKATTSNEASFLSLDLHALAAQLEKIDLSKRLFVEADLLPIELLPEELHEIKASKNDSDESPAEALYNRSSETIFSSNLVEGSDNDQLKSVDQVKDEPRQIGKPGQLTEQESSAELNFGYEPNKKPSGYEAAAAAAEAELDMLLGSFSETNLLGSPRFIEKSTDISQGETSIEPVLGSSSDEYMHTFPAKIGTDLSKVSLAADLDDTLDDLLKETSSQADQRTASLMHEVKATPKAKVLDDFDSWLDTI